MRTFLMTSYDLEQLDDPTIALIDRIFADDEAERSGVRPSPLYVSPYEEDSDECA